MQQLPPNLVDLNALGLDAEALTALTEMAPLLRAFPKLQPGAQFIKRVIAAKRAAVDPWQAPAGFAPEFNRITISPAGESGRWVVNRAGRTRVVRSANGAIDRLSVLLASPTRAVLGTHRDAERVRRLLRRQIRLDKSKWQLVVVGGDQMRLELDGDIELVVELPAPETTAAGNAPV